MTRLHARFLALALLVLAPLAGAAPETYERWYALTMNDEKVGWLREALEVDDDGNLVTTARTVMSIDRMGQSIELEIATRFVETPDGEPVSMTSKQDIGAGVIEQRYVFRDDHVAVTSSQMGLTRTKKQPLPEGAWLTPHEAQTYLAKRLEAGAESITLTSLDPSMGLTPITLERAIVGETNVEVMGKTVPAIEWEVRQSVLPQPLTEFVDEEGNVLRSSVPFGGIVMDMVATTEALATAPFDAPELMARTFVRPDRAIDNARTSRRAVYLLRRTGESDTPFFDTGVFGPGAAQRAESVDEDTIRLTVDLDDPMPATVTDEQRASALGASTWIDPTDEAIVALTHRALKPLGSGADAMKQAKALEAFVARHIEDKTLGVGFATASEACRTREGDCSEHAMLLGAMLRAAGIPSRIVTGLVYADGFMGERAIFGYHMWTQALIETKDGARWVDLDAAVMPMDATHLAVSRSTFTDDDPVSAMIDLVEVFGQLEIEVVSVE